MTRNGVRFSAAAPESGTHATAARRRIGAYTPPVFGTSIEIDPTPAIDSVPFVSTAFT